MEFGKFSPVNAERPQTVSPQQHPSETHPFVSSRHSFNIAKFHVAFLELLPNKSFGWLPVNLGQQMIGN